MDYNLQLDKNWLDFDQIKAATSNKSFITITPEAIKAVQHCRAYLDKKVKASNKLF